MLTVEWVVGVPWQVLAVQGLMSSDESDAPEETLSP